MEEFRNQAEVVLRSQFANEELKIGQKEDGREGVDFFGDKQKRKSKRVVFATDGLVKTTKLESAKRKARRTTRKSLGCFGWYYCGKRTLSVSNTF